MRYVDQGHIKNNDELEYKGKPLEFEIEGLSYDSPKKTTVDEEKKKPAKDEEEEKETKKEAKAPKEDKEEEEPKKEKKAEVAKETAAEEKPAKEEKAPAAAGGFIPAELDMGNAMVQKSHKSTISVDGEEIPLDTEMSAMEKDDDPSGEDYLQIQEEQGESVMDSKWFEI